MKIIKDIIKLSKRNKIDLDRQKTSLDWFRRQVAKLDRVVRPPEILQEKVRLKQKVELGKMYNYLYDPKLKEELPYYDKFPLCIPIKFEVDGFIGINLHYLSPLHRAMLLTSLREFEKPDSNKQVRLKITYQLLISSNKYKMFRPCLKKYLYSHVRSPFARIEEDEWNVAVFLPTESFMKAKKTKVWKDSSGTF